MRRSARLNILNSFQKTVVFRFLFNGGGDDVCFNNVSLCSVVDWFRAQTRACRVCLLLATRFPGVRDLR